MKTYNKTPELIKAVENATDTALTAVGTMILEQAEYLVPVKTGNLKGSLSYSVSGESAVGVSHPANRSDGVGRAPEGHVYIGTNVVYAASVEFGFGRRRSKSYLRAALDVNRDRIPVLMNQAYRSAIDRVRI